MVEWSVRPGLSRRISAASEEEFFVSLDWTDDQGYAQLCTFFKNGSTRQDVLEDAKKISGNGDCMCKGLEVLVTDDVMDLCGEGGVVVDAAAILARASELKRRWLRRAVKANLREAGVSDISFGEAVEILRELCVECVLVE